MKKTSRIEKINKLFSIAADQTRLKIMISLLDESRCCCGKPHDCGQCQCLTCMPYKSVGDIAKEINASPSLVSHQIRVLREADLVTSKKEGLKVFYRLKDGHVQQLVCVAIEHVEEEKKHD